MSLHRRFPVVLLLFAVLLPPAARGVELVVRTDDEGLLSSMQQRHGATVVDTIPELGLARMAFPREAPSPDEIAEDPSTSEPVQFWFGPGCLQSSVWILGHGSITPSSHDPVAPGAGLSLALLDGALDIAHPAIQPAWIGGHDFVDGDADPGLDAAVLADPERLSASGHRHATAVASALVTVAPGVRLLAYRVLDEDCVGDNFTVAKALVRAVGDGAQVVVLPLGSVATSFAVTEALAHAVAHDVLVVAAAGNNATGLVDFPARDDRTLAVAALGSDETTAEFSSTGSAVELADFGENLIVALAGGGAAIGSGTSLAAARTAGAAAVLRAARPHLSAEQARSRLVETATPVWALDEEGQMLRVGRTDLAAALAVDDQDTAPRLRPTASLFLARAWAERRLVLSPMGRR